jgi:hypothetical protein
MGRRGGRARARRLSAERRREIASLGGHARRDSLLAAGRILENLRYAASLLALAGGRQKVRRVTNFGGPLPAVRARRTTDGGS